MSYKVKTEIFEGPLDLLLQLVEKRKLFINEIALAEVTDDYIEYVNTLKDFPTADIAHFILVASTLLLIKSKSLLPVLSLTEEEKNDVEDLERRLKLYQRFRELSVHIESRFGTHISFERPNALKRDIGFAPSEDFSKEGIIEGIKRILTNLPKPTHIPKKVVQKVISLEEMITSLTTRIQKGIKTSFKDFAKGHVQKVDVIVSFLAMLELVKQGIIAVEQREHFGDIEMESNEVGLPSYE